MTVRLSGNQSGVQQSAPLIALAAPVAISIRATLQLAPKELDTPESQRPSGDQVNCWKKPLRGSVRTTRWVLDINDRDPLDRQTRELLAVGAPARPGIFAFCPERRLARAVGRRR